MKVLIALGLVAFVYGQFPNFGDIFNFGTRDSIHGYSFEYHRNDELILVRNVSACFVVNATKEIESKMQHRDTREQLEDELYAQIKAHTGETVSSISDLRTNYHDNYAVIECFRHSVYELQYIPSS
ncbi:uncharacterized protein LOC124262815 [Haliotis rubra]|uniref:uncharacterized protein LOC124262815 n=1 Tax=Haliotis rubra TaxID=36100 RepID=UPI001EE50849|nr:uncharacterized protein LOC124262815 [Haliotis rubra]